MEYTFDAIWRLLNPQGEFVRRVNACGKIWNGLAEHQRRHIYETINNLKAQGKYVNPNPLFAIQDNDTAEPFNWNGHELAAGRQYVTRQAVRDRPMERQMGNVHDRGCAGLWNGNKE